jgi:D-alanyl-lipoteichoic acid acyltransferase DltB (MBOAT superfamily)
LGLGSIDWRLSIILPVGISFYTFQTMSYSWDVYRGEVKPVRNFWDFALFVSFFPQLVAGPIERAKNLIPQVLSPRHFSREQFYEGSYLIFFGLFKKVYIADVLAKHVDEVFSMPLAELVWVDVLMGGMLFAFQIYCDFSGYTDIARGVSKWLGFDIMLNFKLPYFSTNPSQFWRQWHISLSTWLRDYLYIPLGGNRNGVLMTFRNLMLTMLLGGLWHGASWTFLLWGGVHGLLLCIHRVWASFMGQMKWFQWLSRIYLYRLVVGFCFFLVVCLTWIIFRAENFEQMYGMLRVLFTLQGQVGDETIYPSHLTNVIWLLFIIQMFQYVKKDLLVVYRQGWLVKAVVYVIMVTKIIEGTGYDAEKFIYFQF